MEKQQLIFKTPPKVELEKLENWVEVHLVVKMDNNQGIPGED